MRTTIRPAMKSLLFIFKVYPSQSGTGLRVIRKMRPAISHVAIFVLFAAYRLFFAIADDIDSRCLNALLYEKFLRGVCTAVAKAKVVFGAAALVTVPLDGEPHVPVLPQECRVLLELGHRIRPDVGFVVIKEDVQYVPREKIVHEHDRCYWWPWRSRWRWHRRNIDGHAREIGGFTAGPDCPSRISDRCWRVHGAVTCRSYSAQARLDLNVRRIPCFPLQRHCLPAIDCCGLRAQRNRRCRRRGRGRGERGWRCGS